MANRRRSGCGTAVAVVLVVAVLAAAAGYVLWARYTATAQYATLKALQAVSWRDYDEFSRWVDVDTVVDRAIEAGAVTPPAAVREAIERSAKAAIRHRVTQGMRGVPRDVPFVALLVGNVIRSVRVTGDDADVTAETTSARRRLRFDLRLRREDGRWRIVEVRNASELLLGGL